MHAGDKRLNADGKREKARREREREKECSTWPQRTFTTTSSSSTSCPQFHFGVRTQRPVSVTSASQGFLN